MKKNCPIRLDNVYFILNFDDLIMPNTLADLLEFQSQSDEIKSKIQDPVLREVVSKTAITEFGFTNAINFVAIAKFVKDYGINTTNQPTVPRHKLQDLIELLTDDNALDLIAEELALIFIKSLNN